MGSGWFEEVSSWESILAILTTISFKLGVIISIVRKYLKNKDSNSNLTGKELLEMGMEIGKSLSSDSNSESSSRTRTRRRRRRLKTEDSE